MTTNMKTTKPVTMKILFVLIAFLSVSAQIGWAQTLGTLVLDRQKAFDGYTLFAPITGKGTYLIDNDGQVVHVWNTTLPPGQAVMLLEDGTLLRTANPGGQLPLSGGGVGGILEKYSWDGKLVWKYSHYSSTYRAHHDVEILPSGNVLLIVWDLKTPAEIIAQGRRAERVTENAVWLEKIIEVKQTGAETGEVVWEWSVQDHLVQNADAAKPYYGIPSMSPTRIDVNSGDTRTDWLHINSVRYNETRNEILVSVHNLHEIWVINKGTGEIVYRYGNPMIYARGVRADQKFYGQHDARWIAGAKPDEPRIMYFNNGQNRATTDPRSYSTVESILPPYNQNGYELSDGQAYGPTQVEVKYPPTPNAAFFATNISGATVLDNGNTLACLGTSGSFIEATPNGEMVWNYISPVSATGILKQGQKPANNQIFKIYKYSKSYPAFTGRNLTPRGKLEDGPLSASTYTPTSHPTQPRFWFAQNGEVVVTILEGASGYTSQELHAYDLLGRNLGVVAKPPLPTGVNTFTVPIGTFIVR